VPFLEFPDPLQKHGQTAGSCRLQMTCCDLRRQVQALQAAGWNSIEAAVVHLPQYKSIFSSRADRSWLPQAAYRLACRCASWFIRNQELDSNRGNTSENLPERGRTRLAGRRWRNIHPTSLRLRPPMMTSMTTPSSRHGTPLPRQAQVTSHALPHAAPVNMCLYI
jgi:hypothetical protein